MEARHVEDDSADSMFSVMETLLCNIESVQLGQVLLYIHLDEYPFLTKSPYKGVHVRVRPQDDGLEPPVPCLELIRCPCPVLQHLSVHGPHLGTPLGRDLVTLAVGVPHDKVLAEMVKDRQALGAPVLQVFLEQLPDLWDQVNRQIAHGINLP